MTTHPFTYGHFGCSQGVGQPDCGRIDARVQRMRFYPLGGSRGTLGRRC
jgi:hypothetical protein